MNISNSVWLITGTSKGLGRALAEAVIAGGGKLMATARSPASLDALVALAPERVRVCALDVTQPLQCEQAIAEAQAAFGRIDVLVNNAGYGVAGAVEEVSDAEARAQLETNFFGALNMCRAVLPVMRKARRGHILQISSVAGFTATAGLGIYNASKFALEGFSEALALEVAALNIRVTLIEPGPFRTDWAGPSMVLAATRIADYDDNAGRTRDYLSSITGRQPGDPVRAAAAMIALVNAEQPPLRVPLGENALRRIRSKLADTSSQLDHWEQLILGADFPKGE